LTFLKKRRAILNFNPSPRGNVYPFVHPQG
jgi:hypothetical protein